MGSSCRSASQNRLGAQNSVGAERFWREFGGGGGEGDGDSGGGGE